MDSGFLLVDKPMDWTSHDVVAYMRGLVWASQKNLPGKAGAKQKRSRVGHTGTLDPFATGLLIVAVGREATKHIDEFHVFPKTYEATIQLGAVSNTQDRTGTIEPVTPRIPQATLSEKDVRTVLASFVGVQEQIPPMFSAKKVHGKKLYELARKGKEIERKPNMITVHNIELLDMSKKTLNIRCVVSTGTYVRTLAHDIGQELGIGAYCAELRRKEIGPYHVEDAIGPKDFEQNNWQKRLLQLSPSQHMQHVLLPCREETEEG
ncbi:MAG: tRNA pseudouridine(55) synthase TruB [Candidatus Magasanikbacteria bacterium CG10_big_fil_rev_8_21_14_0_10_43_6]|uniref:tRNA pseudouridine synthase B n=1 Tax=Candidatus Magasanikbacteria bacterium CG10_big_fil_rev_8_21_14_0_10_43_6 TaxID=1974650 RepID=A0A2M6W0R9_9BACT|nr:MAG: tRNA pseudouridine(55) synthase TruB [Candidatus Magasanikbacteria bacterium CG10_big_fil_rev_8_21_14_0_10_43_6]